MPNISSSPLLPYNGQLVLNEVIKIPMTRSYLLILHYFKDYLAQTRIYSLSDFRILFQIVALAGKNIQWPENGSIPKYVSFKGTIDYNIAK